MTGMDENTQGLRVVRLRNVVREFRAAEGLGDFIAGRVEVPRWALVTNTHEFVYVKPFATASDAAVYAAQVAADRDAPEAPQALIDLDTGASFPAHATVWFEGLG